MPEKPSQPVSPSAADAPVPAGPPTLRTTWQMPALAGALVLLGAGVVAAILTAPRPDPAKVMAQAEGLVEREQYGDALTVLNDRVKPYYERGNLSPEQMRRFHVLRARSVYLGERKNGAQLEENAKTVIQEYGDAEHQWKGPLEPRDLSAWADVNVTLGRTEKALEIAGHLPPEEKAARGRIYKRIVEHELAHAQSDPERMLKLLGEYLKDPQASAADRAWALGMQAEFLIKRGQIETAINKIIQTLPGILADTPPDALGELYLILGSAYAETGALAEAGKRLDQALTLLLPSDPRRARALVLRGRIDEQTNPDPAEGKTEAKQKYTSVIEQFAESEARLPALLGLGEVEAALGDTEASLRAFDELVKEMAAGKHHPDATDEGVTRSLLDRARARLGAGETALGLRYAELAERLYPSEKVPPELLLVLAQCHRKLAEEMLAPGGAAGSRRVLELAKVDAGVREQARVHLIAAGGYFKHHAERIGVENNSGFGQSLWLAADSLDLAGDAERSIPLFTDYARYFPGDPRQAEARYRLGQGYQARGDYGTATGFYRGLIDDTRTGSSNVGPFADLSYVPLAQCLLMGTDSAGLAEAESLLQRVVEGNAGDPTTPQFRDGLIELAGIKARRGDYAGAIQHLEDAVTRFPDDPRIDQMRFNLADAERQDARAIKQTLGQGMPDRQRQLLEQTRLDRLKKAQIGFELVRRALEARDPRALSKLEKLQLRNSGFFLGDCAYELKDYDAAIHHYDAAREKYPTDPASLVAMVQIVNAYLEQGDVDRARTANERAIRFYNNLPLSAWDDPTLPMTHEEWKSWLDSMGKLLKDRTKSAAVGSPAAAEP